MTTSESPDSQSDVRPPDGRRPVRVRTENGRQVIELPDDLRLVGDTVWISRGREAGDILLSTRPATSPLMWGELMAQLDELYPAADNETDDDALMKDWRSNGPSNGTGVFDDVIDE